MNEDGPIDTELALKECNAIYQKLCEYADDRSVVHRPLGSFFNRYKHGRSYQGYFRDTFVISKIDGTRSWLVVHDVTLDDAWLARARKIRTRKRDAARRAKDVRLWMEGTV